jgi:hypothetical protein
MESGSREVPEIGENSTDPGRVRTSPARKGCSGSARTRISSSRGRGQVGVEPRIPVRERDGRPGQGHLQGVHQVALTGEVMARSHRGFGEDQVHLLGLRHRNPRGPRLYFGSRKSSRGRGCISFSARSTRKK